MIIFKQVKSKAKLSIVEEMARVIWNEHYTPIIGADQVTYMLKKFQSVKAMQSQLEMNYEYYLIQSNDLQVGYLSIIKRESELFLSKIYVLQKFRRQGIGKESMKFVENKAIDYKCKKVVLTVNKDNLNSIKAYEDSGYLNKGACEQDIGAGFIMDDYKMEKELRF